MLSRYIHSTQDDSIYLNISLQQAAETGIDAATYEEVSRRISGLNRTIRNSKEQGITVINGFKNSGLTKGPGPGAPTSFNYIHIYTPNNIGISNNRFTIPRTLGQYMFATCVVRKANALFTLIVTCLNSNQQYLVFGSPDSHSTPYTFSGRPDSSMDESWFFSIDPEPGNPNSPDLTVELEFLLHNDRQPN